MAEWSIVIGAPTSESSTSLQWRPPNGNRLIDPSLVRGGVAAYLRGLEVNVAGTPQSLRNWEILIAATDSGTGGRFLGPDLTDAWESGSHSIEIRTASLSLVVPGPSNSNNAGTSDREPYTNFRPPTSRNADLNAFNVAYRRLQQSEKNGTTLIFRDFVPVAPSWTDDTGDAITGVAGTAISPVTVPAVDAGDPTPVYTVSGLPSGLVFDPATRIISGTPAAAGSGTITITATNSAGSDTRTYNYAFTDPNLAPSVAIAT